MRCENLKRLEIPHGVEYIGEWCFSYSGIEEITLPSTLKKMGENIFKKCENLKTVYVEGGCTADVWNCGANSAEVLPVGKMIGGQFLQDLRRQKDVVIPEGVQEISTK